MTDKGEGGLVCGGGCSQFGLGCCLGWAAAVGGVGLEEVGVVVGGGQWAGGVAAGEAVAQVGDEAVGGVAQEERDVAGERGELGPGCGELGEAGEDGGGAGEDAGLAVGGGGEDEDGVGDGGDGFGHSLRLGFELSFRQDCGNGFRRGMKCGGWEGGGLVGVGGAGIGSHCGAGVGEGGEEGLGCGGVGWGEAEAVVAVAAEEPADGGVAEGAVAVEEDEQAVAERVGCRRWQAGAGRDGIGRVVGGLWVRCGGIGDWVGAAGHTE